MRRTRRYVALVAAAVALTATGIAGYQLLAPTLAQPSNTVPAETTGPEPPNVIVVSSSVAPFSELAYGPSSTRIVVATVTKFLPAVWDDNKEFIFTPAVVAVERQVKGPSAAQELTVYQRGGTVGSVTMIYADAPRLEQGRRYLFFLSEVPRQKSEKLTISGGHVGAVWLEGDLALPNRGAAAPTKPEPLGPLIANVEAAMRGEFHPTPTPTWAPPPTQIPSGGLYPPKPPRPVKPGE